MMKNWISLLVSFCIFTRVASEVVLTQYLLNNDFSEGEGNISNCIMAQTTSLCRTDRGPTFLTDGDLGPETTYDSKKALGWNTTFKIVFNIDASAKTKLTQVNMFFYNEPSIGVGLPDITVFYSDTVSDNPQDELDFTLLNNQDMSQDDMRRRNVSIVITSDASVDYRFFAVRFDFSSVKVNTLRLYEIQLLNEAVPTPTLEDVTVIPGQEPVITLGPVNVTATYTLSCSVANEGLYVWEWTLPSGVTQHTVLSADGTRASFLELTQMSTQYEGEYTCAVRYESEQTVSNSSVTELKLEGRIVSSPSELSVGIGHSATLTCEEYGYISMQPITWIRPGANDVIMNNERYDITGGFNSANYEAQTGETTPGPAFVSTLTIKQVMMGDFGVYVCQSGDNSLVDAVTLKHNTSAAPPPTTQHTDDTGSPTTTPTTPTTPPPSSSLPAIAAAVAAVIGLLIILAIVIVILLIIFVWNKKRKSAAAYSPAMDSPLSKDFIDNDPNYSQIVKTKPAPPPFPDHFSPLNDVSYAQIDCDERNGHIEMMNMHRNSVSPGPNPDNPTLVKSAQQMQGMTTNPMYVSADNVEDESSRKNTLQMRQASAPTLEFSDESMINIYAEPSNPRLSHHHSLSLSPPPPLPDPIYSEATITPAIFQQQQSQPFSADDQSLHPYASIYENPNPLKKSEGPLTVSSQSIEEIRDLGLGQFGQVVLAKTVGLSLRDLKLSDIDDKSVGILVALKKLKPNAESGIKEAFEKEIKFMSRLHHDNVVRLLGVCLEQNAFILMEYMESGDLNQYLHKFEIAPSDQPPTESQIMPSNLLYMSLQIANGMRYLASLHFVHRDLATRNCLVGSDNTVKIADFGMSRNLYSAYYYRIKGKAMLPIRWMANECFYGRFSEKTDVWAFGITMWEIFTVAKKQPFEGMTDQEVINDAIKGPGRQVPPCPEGCPPEIYDTMQLCWSYEPSERATFEDIYSTLSAMHSYSDIP